MGPESTFIRVDSGVDAVLAQDRPIHRPDSFTPGGVGGLVDARVDYLIGGHFAPMSLAHS
jgi:hypothetical protein